MATETPRTIVAERLAAARRAAVAERVGERGERSGVALILLAVGAAPVGSLARRQLVDALDARGVAAVALDPTAIGPGGLTAWLAARSAEGVGAVVADTAAVLSRPGALPGVGLVVIAADHPAERQHAIAVAHRAWARGGGAVEVVRYAADHPVAVVPDFVLPAIPDSETTAAQAAAEAKSAAA